MSRSDALKRAGLLEMACGELISFFPEPNKGYGFIALDSGGPDAMVHRHAFRAAGLDNPPLSAKLYCLVEHTSRGPYAVEVVGLVDDVIGPECARAKNFKPEKRRGHVIAADGKDIRVTDFIYKKSGVAIPERGQELEVWYVETPRGRNAKWVRFVT